MRLVQEINHTAKQKQKKKDVSAQLGGNNNHMSRTKVDMGRKGRSRKRQGKIALKGTRSVFLFYFFHGDGLQNLGCGVFL